MKSNITSEEIGVGMRTGKLWFCGFYTEEEAKTLDKRKYKCLVTNGCDIVGEMLGIGQRNVYVYRRF